MKATKFFPNSTKMAEFAQQFRQENKQNRWFIRTFLKCDHRINEQRKAMVLVDNESIVQRLVTCKVCCNAQKPQKNEQ
jgi:hypothetical protein